MAVCVMLFKPSYPMRWIDMKHMFGMRVLMMSKMFYEVIKSLVGGNRHIMENVRAGIMTTREEMYANVIHEKGAPLSNCVGFIECTKIVMCRPSGRGSLLRAVSQGTTTCDALSSK